MMRALAALADHMGRVVVIGWLVTTIVVVIMLAATPAPVIVGRSGQVPTPWYEIPGATAPPP